MGEGVLGGGGHMSPGDLIQMTKSCYAVESIEPRFRYTTRILEPGVTGLVLELSHVGTSEWMRILTDRGPAWCQTMNARRVQ